jgi:hypothetical protein
VGSSGREGFFLEERLYERILEKRSAAGKQLEASDSLLGPVGREMLAKARCACGEPNMPHCHPSASRKATYVRRAFLIPVMDKALQHFRRVSKGSSLLHSPKYPDTIESRPLTPSRETQAIIVGRSADVSFYRRSSGQIDPGCPGRLKGTGCHNRYGVPISRS